jgi:hypothetical protein
MIEEAVNGFIFGLCHESRGLRDAFQYSHTLRILVHDSERPFQQEDRQRGMCWQF